MTRFLFCAAVVSAVLSAGAAVCATAAEKNLFVNDGYFAACWTAVSMRDQNTGKLADVFVPGEFGDDVPEVECIDLLNGGIQKLNVEKATGGFKVRTLVMRDYPLVFRCSTR